jgi:hypothetical protein
MGAPGARRSGSAAGSADPRPTHATRSPTGAAAVRGASQREVPSGRHWPRIPSRWPLPNLVPRSRVSVLPQPPQTNEIAHHPLTDSRMMNMSNPMPPRAAGRPPHRVENRAWCTDPIRMVPIPDPIRTAELALARAAAARPERRRGPGGPQEPARAALRRGTPDPRASRQGTAAGPSSRGRAGRSRPGAQFRAAGPGLTVHGTIGRTGTTGCGGPRKLAVRRREAPIRGRGRTGRGAADWTFVPPGPRPEARVASGRGIRWSAGRRATVSPARGRGQQTGGRQAPPGPRPEPRTSWVMTGLPARVRTERHGREARATSRTPPVSRHEPRYAFRKEPSPPAS